MSIFSLVLHSRVYILKHLCVTRYNMLYIMINIINGGIISSDIQVYLNCTPKDKLSYIMPMSSITTLQ